MPPCRIGLLACPSERSSDCFGGAGFSLSIRAQLGHLPPHSPLAPRAARRTREPSSSPSTVFSESSSAQNVLCAYLCVSASLRGIVASPQFRRQRLLQYQESLHLPRAQFPEIHPTEPSPHQEVLHQPFALRCNVRPGAALRCHRLSRPHRRPSAVRWQPQPPAPPALLQAAPPARVALPTGLVGELKMEGD